MKNKKIALTLVSIAVVNSLIGQMWADEYFAYDESGNVNRTYDSTFELPEMRNHTGNLLGRVGEITYSFDKSGSLNGIQGRGETRKFKRGFLDKILAIERDGRKIRFFYDHNGYLVGKGIESDTILPWIWEGADPLVVNGTFVDAELELRDYLGSSLESGPTPAFAAALPGISFTGKFFDADLGAYVFPFRNYDPRGKRWLEADPSGYPDGRNRYAYAGGDPLSRVDPLGLDWKLTESEGGDYECTQSDNSGLSELELNGSLSTGVINPQTIDATLWGETRENDLWPNPDDIVERTVVLRVNCDVDDGVIFVSRTSGTWKKIRSNPVIGIAMRAEAVFTDTEKTELTLTNDHKGRWEPSGVTGAELSISTEGGMDGGGGGGGGADPGIQWQGGEKEIGGTTSTVFQSYEDG